jgi:hypothetical protein
LGTSLCLGLNLLVSPQATAAAAKDNFTSGSAGVGQVWSPSPEDKATCISGIYPHLTVFNTSGECGMGAIVPWADKLWFLTYPPHKTQGSDDKLYTVDKDLKLEIRPESVGGTHANRMIHQESRQLIIGPYFIDDTGKVRAVEVKNQLIGRMTTVARHLTDPTNKVIFYDMEGAVYEVEVHSLAVTRLFEKPVAGWHGKGGYTAQGRFVLSNNGEGTVYKKKYDFLAGSEPIGPEEMGALAEWDGKNWRLIERRQFTEVTGPGGILGSPTDQSPLWAMGWDKRSVILKLLDNGQWHTFRLPKASYTQESRGGYYTEWPRIREVTDGRLLAHMQCLFYDFPKTFSKNNYGGLKPISTYTRMPVDYCAWQGKIVMSRDDASIMQNELAGQSHSALWFGTWNDLENLGTPIGWGGPWLDDDIGAEEISSPFLVNGFSEGVLHLRHESDTAVEFTIEADQDGHGQWRSVATINVPAKSYTYRILADELKAQWVRVKAAQQARGVQAFFRLGNPARPALPERFKTLADIGYQGEVIDGVIKPALRDARTLLFAANHYAGKEMHEKNAWTMDGKLKFASLNDPAKEEILRTKYGFGPKADFTVDAASVIVTAEGKRYRLPKSAAEYDQPFASGWPRGKREVVTERNLLNAHGTFYEVPRQDAGGFQRMRPICTHQKRISDFASWRGMLVLAGVRGDAAPDEHCLTASEGKAGLWFGDVDDLWRMGAPIGTGGPWKDTAVTAHPPSDPYLMAGYRTKSVELSHQEKEALAFTIEVDFIGNGTWNEYRTFRVEPEQTTRHTFPAGYSAHWVRLKTDRKGTVSAIFRYAE